jgi:hypothetical protein
MIILFLKIINKMNRLENGIKINYLDNQLFCGNIPRIIVNFNEQRNLYIDDEIPDFDDDDVPALVPYQGYAPASPLHFITIFI